MQYRAPATYPVYSGRTAPSAARVEPAANYPVPAQTYRAPAASTLDKYQITEAEHAQLWRDLSALGATIPAKHRHYLTSSTPTTKPASDPNKVVEAKQNLEIVETMDRIADKLLILQNRIDQNTQGVDKNKASIAVIDDKIEETNRAVIINAQAIKAILERLGEKPAKPKPKGDPNATE